MGKVIKAQPKQQRLISCPCDEVCYGGARGGGKTFGVLLDFAQYQYIYGGHSRGLLLRKTYNELEQVIDESSIIFPPLGAVWKSGTKVWHFPNGATLKLRQLERDSDADKFQGHEYPWICFDEAGNWSDPKPLDKLKACQRSAQGIPAKLIYTVNPGGRGHNWIKRKFIDPVPPENVNRFTDSEGIERTRVFIPATVDDNQELLRNDPGYLGRLNDSGPEWLVKAWRFGLWDIVAGGALDDVWFRERHVIPQVNIPSSWRVDRGFDWGSASPFSVLWFAESDGSPLTIDGKESHFPVGSIIVMNEWYGAKKDTEDGLNLTATDIAEEIKAIESGFDCVVKDGPADNSIYDVSNGNCIADDMKSSGVTWERSNKGPGSRIAGLNKIRQMLKESGKDHPESQGLWIMNNCRRLIEHLPILSRDDKKIEDIDTTQPDHDYDVLRYRLLATKSTAKMVEGLSIFG